MSFSSRNTQSLRSIARVARSNVSSAAAVAPVRVTACRNLSSAIVTSPRPTPCVRVATPSLIRFLQKDAVQKDKSWVDKGAVKYDELKSLTEAPTGEITIIDVREPSETSQGMIPSAVNVPLSEFGQAFNTSSEGVDFDQKYAFPRPSFSDKVIVYCRSGKRSQQALEEAQKRGWWNVRNYTGSWLDWNAQEEARGKQDD